MTISARPMFNPEIPWANGAGCLKCGSNYSDLGAKAGVHCVDLGVQDGVIGNFALCYDCALQVALAIDCVPKADVLAVVEEARALADEATTQSDEILAAAAQARLDRDVVERLLGSVYQSDDTDLADAVSAAL